MTQLRLIIGSLAVTALAGCYHPSPKAGAFRCAADAGSLCPSGLVCDPTSGLCVTSILTLPDLLPPPQGDSLFVDGGSLPACDEKLRSGAFVTITLLDGASSAADETSLTLSRDGTRIYFLSTRNGPAELFSASLDASSPLATSPASGVTLSDPTVVPAGGALTVDGAYWFAGGQAGTTRLYRATPNGGPLSLLLEPPIEPTTTTCGFADPFFELADAARDLYLSYSLAGCARAPLIVTGRAGRQLGAFYGSMATTEGHSAPTLSPSGLTLFSATTASPARLDYAVRPSLDLQFSGPAPLPLGALGGSITSARQLVVRDDCRLAYLVAERAGGLGGADLWALEIAP